MNCFICNSLLSKEKPVKFSSIYNLYCKDCDFFYYFYNKTIFAKKYIEFNSSNIEISLHLRGERSSIYVMKARYKYDFGNCDIDSELFVENYPITLDVYDNYNYIPELTDLYKKCLKYLDNLIFM